MHRRIRLLASAALLLTGCAAEVPRPTLLALPAHATALAAAAPPAADAPVLVLRRIALPEYLTTRRVRFRAEASTLGEWPNTYWAERVEIGVAREFASALRSALLGWSVCEGTCADAAPRLALQVDIVRLDFVRAERRTLAGVRLQLAAAQGEPRVLASLEQSYDLPATADTPQAQAETFAALLDRVAQAIAPMVQGAQR